MSEDLVFLTVSSVTLLVLTACDGRALETYGAAGQANVGSGSFTGGAGSGGSNPGFRW